MMNPLLASVAPATTARPLPCQASACDGDPADKGFATALDQAQAPTRAKSEAAASAKDDAKAVAKADPQTAPQTEPRAESATGTKPGKTHTPGSPREGETDMPADEACADGADPSGLALLLPGWPTPPAATTHGPAAATPAEAAARLSAGADTSAAVRASIAGIARRDSATLTTQPPTQDPVPAATPTAVAYPALEQRLPTAAAPTDRKAMATPGRVEAGTEVALAVPAKAGSDHASSAVLPLPTLAAPAPHPMTSALAPAVPSFEARIAAAVDSSAFAPALASHVTWLVREGLQQARFSLNPLEMGPLSVKIVLDGTQARVDFSADIAGTRAAIEASLPTLAAALHDKGLTLSGGGVFDGQSRPGAQGERSHREPSRPAGDNAAAPEAAVDTAATRLHAGRGLVDLVA